MIKKSIARLIHIKKKGFVDNGKKILAVQIICLCGKVFTTNYRKKAGSFGKDKYKIPDHDCPEAGSFVSLIREEQNQKAVV